MNGVATNKNNIEKYASFLEIQNQHIANSG